MTKYRPELLVKAKMADPQIEVIETNGREVRVIEFLAGLDAQLINGQTVLADRLKKIPSAWRNFRLAATMTEKVLDELYKTLPPKTLLHMQRIRQFGEVIIRPRPACKLPDDVQIVDKDDLKHLINVAMAAECAVCLKDTRQQKKCKLRRTLETVAQPEALKNDGLCPYTHVAAGNEYGRYI